MKYLELKNGRRVIVDDEDYPFVSRLALTEATKGNIVAHFEHSKKAFSIPVSSLLMKPLGIQQVIHINKDKYDLRKENLKLASMSQLNHGIRINYKHKNKTSKYRGVSFKTYNKKTGAGKWKAQMMCNGVRWNGGMFITELEAAIAYDKKARELYGEYAYQNEI